MAAVLSTIERWITERDAAYLGKENSIVYYDSYTGRVDDLRWCTVTLTELRRILRTSYLTKEDIIAEDDIIQVFQELDRVYTMGVKSVHKTKPEYFNYYAEANADPMDMFVGVLLGMYYKSGTKVILRNWVEDAVKVAASKLSQSNPSPSRLNELVKKHASEYAYDIRFSTNKILIGGKYGVKKAALVLAGCTPKDYQEYSPELLAEIQTKAIGETR